MPAPIASTTGNAAQRKPASGTRFELPQLTPVNYSLTEGTDIPPPPESPVEEQPSSAQKLEPTEQGKVANPAGDVASPATPTTSGNGVYEGRGRTSNADQPPLSPASTTRPGSIRRFLSRRSLNNHYANGSSHNKSSDDLSMMDRPGSALEMGHNGVVRPKRSSSWFRRFGSSSNGNTGNRTSVVYEEERKVEKKGPPPPSLPELKLGSGRGDQVEDGGSLGGEEIFKDIK